MSSEESSRAAAAAARLRLTRELVAAGQEDREAFRRLYRLTSSKLFGICLRICGDRQVAEDVLQEVYATIWRRAGAYDPGRSSPITWMATIAHNRAIDWRRSVRVRSEAYGRESDAIADPADAADDRLLLDEADRQLHRCLDELDDGAAAAIRTAFFDGATYVELAARRGVPLGTMKSVVRRGLLKLRRCLEQEEER